MSRWRPSVTSTASARKSWRSARARARSRAGRRCSPPAASTRCSCARRRCTCGARDRRARARPRRLPREAARSLAGRRRAIVAAWQESGTVCAVGYQWRSLDVRATSCARCCADRAGPARQPQLRADRGARHDLEQGAAWFADPAISGGLLFELASHDIDLQIALAGRWSRCRRPPASGLLALADRPATGLDDSVLGAPALRRRRPRRRATSPGARAVPAALRARRAGGRRGAATSSSIRSSSCAAAPAARRSRCDGSEHPRALLRQRFLDAVAAERPRGGALHPSRRARDPARPAGLRAGNRNRRARVGLELRSGSSLGSLRSGSGTARRGLTPPGGA